MSTSKHIDKICCSILAATLLLTLIFANAGRLGIQPVNAAVAATGYASRLFDVSSVHTIDIVMDDWDTFIENCTNEEYAACTVIIDGEAYHNIAIRAKGNTSLSSVEAYGNDRYSFKIEFDHYDSALSYYGLDKLCLNNIIQDNTYMKDYLTYRLMHEFGVDAPLCSYTNITVNGEAWGLYLAVEGIEESFLTRNYGNDYGQLYKPDSTKMGGGRGYGREFNMEDFNLEDFDSEDFNPKNIDPENSGPEDFNPEGFHPENPGPGDFDFQNDNSEGFDTGSDSEKAEDTLQDLPDNSNKRRREKPDGDRPLPDSDANSDGPSGNGMRSNDVSLIYTDDDFESYSNIFDNAKTTLTDSDKARLIASLKKLNNTEDIDTVVDVDEVIRYFVVHNFVLNFDSYTGSLIHNYYLYEKNGQFSMIPWDYNLAFGSFAPGNDATSLVNYPIDTPVSGGTTDSRPMLAWIFSQEEYTDLYHQYFKEFVTDYFDSGYFESMMDSVSDMIAPYVQNDPTKFCSYEKFETGVTALRSFCLLRAESVSGQLDGQIPSTADGQAQNTASLIDASDLSISDTGSMGKMGGFHSVGF